MDEEVASPRITAALLPQASPHRGGCRGLHWEIVDYRCRWSDLCHCQQLLAERNTNHKSWLYRANKSCI